MAVNPVSAQTGSGVCFAKGFSAGVAAADIKGRGNTDTLDVTVITSDRPCAAGGVFTQNLVKGGSGNAVQNMNMALGLDPMLGLPVLGGGP